MKHWRTEAHRPLFLTLASDPQLAELTLLVGKYRDALGNDPLARLTLTGQMDRARGRDSAMDWEYFKDELRIIKE